MRQSKGHLKNYIPVPLISCIAVRIKQHAHLKSTVTVSKGSAMEVPSRIIGLHRRKIMDAKPPRIPTPDQVFSPDPEPVAVEFLGDELPAHVRAFLDEQRKAHEQK
jgi:hypothetical protein